MYLKDVVLGIDFGNTIVYSDANSNKVAYTGAIEVIASCCRQLKNVYIISKVNEPQRIRVLSWLESVDFYGKTGLPKHHVFFCGARNQKGLIASKLGINCFIDDRPEVLAHIDKSVYRILFRPIAQDVTRFGLQHLQVASGWNEIEQTILRGI